jgi:hypothetical protein
MATDDDAEHEERVRRRAAQYRADQDYFDKRDEAVRLAETGRQYKDSEREIQARMALNRMQQGSAATPRARKKWDGPMDNRPIVNGKAVVSAEELADFRQKFGADKTLRDLLNADKGRGPSAASPAARGMQGANVAPAPMSLRSLLGTKESAAPAAEDAAERFRRLPGTKSPEEERDEAKNRTMAALSLLGGAGANVGLRALAGRMGAGWRNRPPEGADPAKWKEIVKQIDEAYPGGTPFKKGGKVKAPSRGRGTGCETRTKKTKYV